MERTRLRRYHERGHFDRETIYAILDAMPLCHVGYVIDGKPAVAPTMQWRDGDRVNNGLILNHASGTALQFESVEKKEKPKSKKKGTANASIRK